MTNLRDGLIGFSFSWLKDNDGRRLFLLLFGSLILGSLLTLAGLVAAITLPKQPVLFAIIAILGLLAYLAIFCYAYTIALEHALKKLGVKPPRLSLGRFYGFLDTTARQFIYIILCLKDLRLLLLPALGLILLIFSNGNQAIILLSVPLFLAYTFATVYQLVRVSLAEVIFLARETSPSEAINESYKITESKAKEVGIALSVLFLASVLAEILIGIIPTIWLYATTGQFDVIQAISNKAVNLPVGIAFAAVIPALENAVLVLAFAYGCALLYSRLVSKKIEVSKKS